MPAIPHILFLDLEADARTHRIREFGAILHEEEYRGSSLRAVQALAVSAHYLCGHNVVDFDLPILAHPAEKRV